MGGQRGEKPRFDKAELQRIRAGVDFLSLVGEVTELAPTGTPGEFLGCCPFHEDRKPSMSVNPERLLFHCYSCGEGGDVFDFVLRIRDCDFPSAVSFLKEYAGDTAELDVGRIRKLEVPERVMSDDPRLLELIGRAATRYHLALTTSDEGGVGRTYLEERGIPMSTAARFGLGCSFDDGQFILRPATRAGFTGDELERSGLVRKTPRGSLQDHFRSPRLLFPIQDAAGQVRGFSGRSLDGAQPKYFNCKTSEAFIKGQMLYGMNQARTSIEEAGRVIVVEGFFDAVALAAHGYPEAVSVMGIAMTKHQATQIAELGVPVSMAYDADDGGTRTLPRALERLRDAGVRDVSVVRLPAGKDPADVLTSEGPEAVSRALAAAEPVALDELSVKSTRTRSAGAKR